MRRINIFVPFLAASLCLFQPSSRAATPPASVKTPAATDPVSANSSPVGTELIRISYFSTELPFLDHFKTASAWVTRYAKNDPRYHEAWSTNEESLLDLDENGWVRSLPRKESFQKYREVSKVLFKDIIGLYPGGRYFVFYDGKGVIRYNGSGKKVNSSRNPQYDELEVDPQAPGGIVITITSTDPDHTGDYIRNIRVVAAKDRALFEKGELFNPLFLKRLAPFNTLRFSEWMIEQDGASPQKDWRDRPKPEDASYSTKGVPLEVMIALCNRLHTNPWFNMPYAATGDYVQKFAKMTESKLDPSLKVYVEYSNEVWNWHLPQEAYSRIESVKRWHKNPTLLRMQWYGMKTAQTCDIWKESYAKKTDSVACVLSTQSAWRGQEQLAFDCPEWVVEGNKPCIQHGVTVYGVTSYFTGGLGVSQNAATVKKWLQSPDGGISEAFKQLEDGSLFPGEPALSIEKLLSNISYHAAIAKKNNLQLVAYEGGQAVNSYKESDDATLRNFYLSLNRNRVMYDLYMKLLNGWRKTGGTLFIHYNDIAKPSSLGSWGLLEYVGQEHSPKYDAITDFARQNPIWWNDRKKE